jgi:hypothetical protein
MINLVKISRTTSVNPAWVTYVTVENGVVKVAVGRPGGTMGMAVFESNYTFDETIIMINGG